MTMDLPKKPTIVIPTKNRRDLLLRSIKDIQRQSLSDYHVIIVDHNSTDGTRELLEELDDSRFIPIFHTGYPDAAWSPKNAALKVLPDDTLGVLFKDDDDLYHSEHSLAYLVHAAIKQGPRFGICTGDYLEIDSNGQPLKMVYGDIVSSSQIAEGSWFPVKSSIFSRTLVDEIPLLPPIRSRETILWAYMITRLIETKYSGMKDIVYLGETIIRKTRHSGNISVENIQNGCREAAEVLIRNFDLIAREVFSEKPQQGSMWQNLQELEPS